MTEEKAVVNIGERGVCINTLDGLQRFAQMVLQSRMAPKDYKDIASVCIAVQYGLELGLTPMQSLQGVAIINGKPSIYGDTLLALCYASGNVESFVEYLEGEGDNYTAVCEVTRKGWKQPLIKRFSVAQAKRARLWGKAGPWTQYPDRMLTMRARGFALRDGFADALKGVISAEEAMDYPKQEPTEVPIEKPVLAQKREEGSSVAAAQQTEHAKVIEQTAKLEEQQDQSLQEWLK